MCRETGRSMHYFQGSREYRPGGGGGGAHQFFSE